MNGLTKHRATDAAALALCTCAVAKLAEGATKACSPVTLGGVYVFTASGYSLVGGVWQPKAIVESLCFNGDGTLRDCAGTQSTPGPTFATVAAPKGDGAWMIQANPNAFQGTVKRLAN